jgi:hypothetical protein
MVHTTLRKDLIHKVSMIQMFGEQLLRSIKLKKSFGNLLKKIRILILE